MAGPETGTELGGPIPHGGNLARARALFPQAPEPLIDLSTGISPYSYPHSPIPRNAFARLPEPAAVHHLKAATAAWCHAPSAAHVAAGPGTQILLPLIAGLLGGKGGAAVLSPTYAEHARAAGLAGFTVAETDRLEGLAGGLLAVVVNPNNPTGRIVVKSDLLALAALMRAKGGLLVVDEAFIDASDAESVADRVDDGGLVVLRSFGKFYGMAGLRLGFAVSRPDIVRKIEERLGPWAVSGPALHVAGEALADNGWHDAMRDRLKADASRLDALLGASGLAVFGGTSLFRLVRDPRASALFRHMGERGIVTRPFEGRPDDLRIGLPEPDGWQRLDDAFRNY